MTAVIQRIREKIASEFSGPTLPFIAFCIALNLTVGQITGALKIPLYLDSIGTVLVAVLSGPWSGIIAGSFANLLAAAFGNPTMMFFIPVVMLIGLFTGFVGKLGWFRHWYLVVLGGLLQGIPAAALSALISANVFGGVTLGGSDFLVLYFRSKGYSIYQSALFQGFIMDPIDKMITYLIVFILIRNLPGRLLQRFRGAANVQPPNHHAV